MAPMRLVSSSLRNRKRWIVAASVATIVIHTGFAAFFLLLLDFRDLADPPEKAIPVEIVTSMPEMPKPPPKPPSPVPTQDPATPAPPPPEQSAATPPPPALVAPPPEPPRAKVQPVADKPANLSPDPPKPDQPSTPAPAPAPSVMTAPDGPFGVAPAAPDHAPSATPPSPPPEDPIMAKLAEALPMDVSALPSTFRAVLSAPGTAVDFQYKGTVYARLQRAHQAMEKARAQHLHGRVVVSFSVDDQGRAADLSVVASSGKPAVDALGIAMVREAEPFPPPPPGPRQVFTPGLIVGDE